MPAPGPDAYERLIDSTSRALCLRIAATVSKLEAAATAPLGALEEIAHLAVDASAARSELVRVASEHGLSGRELQVLAAATFGVPRSRLAAALGIGENTVKTFIKKMLDKLGQQSLDEAVWWVRGRLATPLVPAVRARRRRTATS